MHPCRNPKLNMEMFNVKLIKELTDKDIGVNTEKSNILYELRKASRAVLFNKENRMV